MRKLAIAFIICGLSAFLIDLAAQDPGSGAFPTRSKADPQAIARGKVNYNTNCAYCHGEDARGGEGGTNLLRSEFVMRDKNGETIGQFLQQGGSNEHKFQFTPSQLADLSAFVGDLASYIHDFRISSRDPGRMRPKTMLVGDGKAGETFFKARCASCHSVTGDLKGIATTITDERSLQQAWLMPVVYSGRSGVQSLLASGRKAKPVRVTITPQDGPKVEGELGRIDDFVVTLIASDGASRTFVRDGDVPKVELNDPMQGHKALLRVYTDDDIHNVTAYMATLK